jgi:hypothetical protein
MIDIYLPMRMVTTFYVGQHAYVPPGSTPAVWCSVRRIPVEVVRADNQWSTGGQWARIPIWAEWVYSCMLNPSRKESVAERLLNNPDLADAVTAAVAAKAPVEFLVDLIDERTT